ncbi:MAG TPA: hypothetical protein VIL46_06785, partial [Gemmataceae bacterium]
YVQAHGDEERAFEAFAELFPETTLLVDTYDTLLGVRRTIDLARKMGERFRVRAIRLDSGDLGELAKQSRRMLDEAGLTGVRIIASSGLDEHEIDRLLKAGAPIDAFGVGTSLAIAEGAPFLDMVYKLVEYAGRPRTKLSAKKVVYPGRKQVFRLAENGRMARDVLARSDELIPGGEPLLRPVMRGGRRLEAGKVSLEEARRYAVAQLARLPEALRGLGPAERPYPVVISEGLAAELRALREELEAAGG